MIMSYINDPREMAIRPESGVTLEQDNRVETMYHWGAMVLDLCDMPVDEYMKPMTVIGVGGGSGSDTGSTTGTTGSTMTKETVDIAAQLLKNGTPIGGDGVYGAAMPMVLGADGGSDEWKVRWSWIGSFVGSVKVSVSITLGEEIKYVSAILTDNDDKMHEELVPFDVPEGEAITEFNSYGVASSDSSDEDASEELTYVEVNNTAKVEYTFKVSNQISSIKISFKRILSGQTVSNDSYYYKDTIASFTGTTDKEGFEFEGWFYEDGTAFVEGSTMPAKNVIVYGKYKPKKYTVEFYLDNVMVKGMSGVSYNTVLKSTQFPSTSKAGYNFLGWNPSSATPITANTVFEGEYEAKEYKITWKFSGSSATTLVRYNEDIDYASAEASAQVVGLTLTGWSYSGVTMPAKDITIIANYSLNYHILSYVIDYDGVETLRASGRTAYGKSISKIALPSEEGYSFSEWEGFPSNGKMPDNDVTVITHKTANEYVLAYYVNIDGNFEEIEVSNKKYGDVITFKDKYEKEGYTLTDWNGEITPMPAYNVSATCVATINQYSVIFKDENDVIISAITVNYGTPIADIIPSIEGKTFTADSDSVETVPVNGVEIKGVVTPNPYIVTINGSATTLLYGDSIDDYINANFIPNEGHHIVITPSEQTVPSNNDLTISFEEVVNVYSISIDSDNSIDVEYGDTILDKLPSEVEEGYYIEGWYDQDNNKIDENTVMGLGNITSLSPNISPIMTDYVIVIEGGETISGNTQYGTKVVDIINLIDLGEKGEDSGYTIKWTVNGSELNEDMKIKNDELNIECEFIPNEYVLTFYNASEIISSDTVAYKSAVVYPTMESKEIDGVEYIFKWSGSTVAEMPSHNLDIKGEYVVKPSAPIYYGYFVNGVYDEDAIISNSVAISDATSTNGKLISIFAPKDEYLLNPSISDDDFEDYQNANSYVHVVLIPTDVDATYTLSMVLKADGKEKPFDKETDTFIIDGTEYFAYTYCNADSMKAQDFDQTWNYTITLK